MERKLASVQKVLNLELIEGADLIEKATILGWSCVVKKGEFKVGELGVYFEIDSFLPNIQIFDFLLKGSSLKKISIDGKEIEGIRLKTKRLKGVISQGLFLPLSILGCNTDLYSEGEDVSNILNIIKYEQSIPAQLAGIIKGDFPEFIPKTDEIRIQSCQEVLNELNGEPYYISEKADGSSMTVYYFDDENKGVCSRNLELKEDYNNSLWKMVEKYKFFEKLKECSEHFAIQMEIVGPGIQKNPMGLKELEVRVFNLYNLDRNSYENYEELSLICKNLEFPMVNILEEGDSFKYTLEELLEKAKGKYQSGKNREGIVIRPKIETYSKILKGRLSFKVINNDYLLKEEE